MSMYALPPIQESLGQMDLPKCMYSLPSIQGLAEERDKTAEQVSRVDHRAREKACVTDGRSDG